MAVSGSTRMLVELTGVRARDLVNAIQAANAVG
jgi:hypothetical protein